MERSMLQYLLLYLFWGKMNSVISPWTLPIIFHATGAWPKEEHTKQGIFVSLETNAN